MQWCWTSTKLNNFEAIKELKLQVPVLSLPDPARPFSVVCDSSDFAIIYTLSQDHSNGYDVVAYDSRQLEAAGKNYTVLEKDLLAIKYALVKFGVKFLASSFLLSVQIMRHRDSVASYLSENGSLSFFCPGYKFEVTYKPTNENVLADVMSRRAVYAFAPVTTLSSSISDLINRAYDRKDHYEDLLRALRRKGFTDSDINLSALLRRRLHQYSIYHGLL